MTTFQRLKHEARKAEQRSDWRKAIALYRELAAEDPGDGAVRMGLGRSLIWDNRLHDGYTVLRRIEVEFPADSAAGRESSDFLLTVLDGYTPHLEARIDASWDSDDLDITRLGAVGSFTVLKNKLFQVLPSLAFYRQPGNADIDAPRLGVGFVFETVLARRGADLLIIGSGDPGLGDPKIAAASSRIFLLVGLSRKSGYPTPSLRVRECRINPRSPRKTYSATLAHYTVHW